MASREVEWTSPPGIYSDGSFTFPYESTSSYLLILTYSFPVSREECHFHNYPKWIPASRSHKRTQSFHYNDKLPRCIGGGLSLITRDLGNPYALKSVSPSNCLADPYKLFGLCSSDSRFLPGFLLVLNWILSLRFQRYN